ncbi:carbohydrate ABC transporter permease [Alphaproteobacteria bacterium]|jgi:alpha-1,4-digalacturonate transport system permease protein|nr:carbohydrate ABC transporter permease [Alphaproteobacteria bacterium]
MGNTASLVKNIVTQKKYKEKYHWTDYFSYFYLFLGVFLMFGPIIWLGLSSVKSLAGIQEYPPTILPLSQIQVEVDGYEKPLSLYNVTLEDGSTTELAEIKRVGITSKMVDPKDTEKTFKIPIDKREKIREFSVQWDNYLDPLRKYNFLLYFKNSIFVTVIATIITLIINSMAAYALSIYEFRGKNIALVFVIGTLLIPLTIILVPVFYVIANFGMINSLWGVILPGAATPTGVFLLRQYMLTLPRELIEAARMDHASEWAIYWRIVLPLSIPAIAVLAIFSIMWRWNDFLWPLIVLSKSEVYTLQIALNAFHGELTSQWNYVLAMTMVTLLPIALIFTYLQKFITTGIASTGMK